MAKSNKWIRYYKGTCSPGLRFSWGSYFSPYPEISINFGFDLGSLYIDLPYDTGRDECENPTYGFYFYKEGKGIFDSFWWCWDMKVYCFHMPWSLDWVRTSVLKVDNTWEHEGRKFGGSKDFWNDEWKNVIKYESYPYTYTLNNGVVQNRIATIHTVEREWRPRWFKWTSLFKTTHKSISIDFNEEVGERTGSWKGGVMGCSNDLLKGETPLDSLRRMEQTRKFK